MLLTQAPLQIDWTLMPTYNTTMAVVAGAALMTIAMMARSLKHSATAAPGERFTATPYSVAFGIMGFILTATGLHMTLAWPMAKYFPFDNVIFGETSLGFGVLLLGAAFVLWKKAGEIDAIEDPGAYLGRTARPLAVLIGGFGAALIAIMFAGICFKLFTAPPEEPISGYFSKWPWMETWALSLLFGLTGIGTILFSLCLRKYSSLKPYSGLEKSALIILWLCGLAYFLFGILNFFTHIGLIVHTMPGA